MCPVFSYYYAPFLLYFFSIFVVIFFYYIITYSSILFPFFPPRPLSLQEPRSFSHADVGRCEGDLSPGNDLDFPTTTPSSFFTVTVPTQTTPATTRQVGKAGRKIFLYFYQIDVINLWSKIHCNNTYTNYPYFINYRVH